MQNEEQILVSLKSKESENNNNDEKIKNYFSETKKQEDERILFEFHEKYIKLCKFVSSNWTDLIRNQFTIY